MNIFEGLQMQGLTLATEDNFNSIPGLALWMYSRERITTVPTDKVNFWGDKSSQSNNLYQNFTNRQPTLENVGGNDLWVKSQPLVTGGQYMQSNRKDYRFLHNGSAYGIYSLIKLDLLDNNQAIIINTSNNNNTTGMNVFVSKGSNGAISIRVKNGTTDVRNNYITNVANTVGSNPIMIFRHVFKGQGVANNMIVSLGNYSNVFTNSATGYSTGDHTIFRIAGADEINKPLRTGITLIYNWTGVPSATIDSYDASVMYQLNKEKLIFQNLDS